MRGFQKQYILKLILLNKYVIKSTHFKNIILNMIINKCIPLCDHPQIKK